VLFLFSFSCGKLSRSGALGQAPSLAFAGRVKGAAPVVFAWVKGGTLDPPLPTVLGGGMNTLLLNRERFEADQPFLDRPSEVRDKKCITCVIQNAGQSLLNLKAKSILVVRLPLKNLLNRLRV